MGLHEGVLHWDSLAKYAAVFISLARSSVTRANSRLSRASSAVRAFRSPEPGNAPGTSGLKLPLPRVELIMPDA